MDHKKARHISKNIKLNQELYFAAPDTKMIMNDIYNSSWFGSPIYSLFSRAAQKLEASYNRSIKVMFDLPLATHRSLIEPLSKRPHLWKVFVKRFLMMIQSMRKSTKPILKMILFAIEQDVRSTTGRNLRMIMMECGKHNTSDITIEDSEAISYHKYDDDEEWRIEYIKYLLEQRETSTLDEEDSAWLEHLCCH